MNKKVVLLTGAAGGIGRATLLELVKNPTYTLCLLDLPASLIKFKKDHPELSKGTYFFPCDIKRKAEIKTVIKAIVAKHESIDI
jgi:NAD(P)-dependent dehydrogenase (short-subunit alcohol dehydrogenase family)